MAPIKRGPCAPLCVDVTVPESWGEFQAGLAIQELQHRLYNAGVAVGEAESELIDTREGEIVYRLNIYAPYNRIGAVTDVLRELPQWS